MRKKIMRKKMKIEKKICREKHDSFELYLKQLKHKWNSYFCILLLNRRRRREKKKYDDIKNDTRTLYFILHYNLDIYNGFKQIEFIDLLGDQMKDR